MNNKYKVNYKATFPDDIEPIDKDQLGLSELDLIDFNSFLFGFSNGYDRGYEECRKAILKQNIQ